MSKWTVRIEDWHPYRINQLLKVHWGRQCRYKKADAELVAVMMHNFGVPKVDKDKPAKRRVGLTIILAKGQRAGDPDAYHKSLLDALVRCGRLKDDNRQWCEITPTVFERGEETPATVITLEDVI